MMPALTKTALAFAVQFEVRDDGLALVFGDETGFVDSVDVGELHDCSASRSAPAFSALGQV